MNCKKLAYAMTIALSLVSTFGVCAAYASPIDESTPLSPAKNSKPLAPGYARFQNNRFGFSMDYPKKILKPLGTAPGTGETFTSKDGKAELCAYGVYNSMDHSLAEMLAEDIKYQRDEGKDITITAKVIGESWYTVAGTVDSDVFFVKAIVTADNRINKFVFRYPLAKKELYDQIVSEVEHSFVAGSAR